MFKKMVFFALVFFAFLSQAQAFDISCQVVKIDNQEVSATLFMNIFLTSSKSIKVEIYDPVQQVKEGHLMHWDSSNYKQNDENYISFEASKKSFFSQYSFSLNKKNKRASFTFNQQNFVLDYCD